MINIYLTVLDTDEDKSRFEDIYVKYKKHMYSIAYGILHNAADAEDAVHQAFLNIACNFNRVREIPSVKLKNYIVIAVRNTSINIYNRNKNAAENLSELDENAAVDVDFFENIDLDELAKKISALPPIYKDILFLHYRDGYSQKELARLLNIPYSTVRKRIERAKKLLKDELEEGEGHGK